jgi:hypothetical protein
MTYFLAAESTVFAALSTFRAALSGVAVAALSGTAVGVVAAESVAGFSSVEALSPQAVRIPATAKIANNFFIWNCFFDLSLMRWAQK